MNFNKNSMFELMEDDVLGVEGYEEVLVAYLRDKWQDSMNLLSKTLKDSMIVVFLYTEEGYKVAMISNKVQNHFVVGDNYLTSGTDFVDLVKSYGRMILIEDGTKDHRLEGCAELFLGYKSMIGIPIHNGEQRAIGELIVFKEEAQNILEEDVKRIVGLTTSLEESIYNRELLKMIAHIKSQDRLTHLITREHMLEMVQVEFDRSQRSEMPFSLVVIDVDDFKSVNDKYGYQVGDILLKEISDLIMDRIRHIDYACRWDSDTFAILLPQTEMIGANQLVSDLFYELTHHLFTKVGRCFFSMGIADFSISDKDVTAMLTRLEKVLYRVKAFGGNNHVARYHRF